VSTTLQIILQNEGVVECDRTMNALGDGILHENFRLADGAVAIPDGPGL
jgi:hypothetical protein